MAEVHHLNIRQPAASGYSSSNFNGYITHLANNTRLTRLQLVWSNSDPPILSGGSGPTVWQEGQVQLYDI